MMNVDKIQKVAVIGAGLMGHGIAQELAQGGYEVGLNDVTDEALEKAIVRIRDNYAMLEREGLLSQGKGEKAIGLVQTSVDIGVAIDGADLVIEAVVEDLALKLDIFEKLDAWCEPQTILATNSSSYMPSKIAVVTDRPEKVVGMHYFNPPFLMPLVEIIKGDQTSDQTAQIAYDLMVKIGKSPVMVQKEIPGFIGNRIQAAVWREILWLVEEGIATPQDIDTVVKTGLGRRLSVAGPFELTDLTSLAMKQAIMEELLPSLASGQKVPVILKEKVEGGELGIRSGKGFYEWTPESGEDLRARVAKALIEIGKWDQ
ncbi:MAG: 3-hydroxyacyl-CoA dehydrogenase family protein [Candidatus Poribacteria bacterium]|nr:3-hydroxyacyl-CoA dehydrogenase family protein [Candidatus Poribacteria bacterium]